MFYIASHHSLKAHILKTVHKVCILGQLFDQLLQFLMRITQLLVQIVAHATGGQRGKAVRTEMPVGIDVRDGAHLRAQDDLHVVGEIELCECKGKQTDGIYICLLCSARRYQSNINKIKKTSYLNRSVCQMHHHRARCPEPRVQMRYPGHGVRFDDRRATRLDQMLSHVALEIRQQLHLLLHGAWEIVGRHIRLLAILVNEVDVATNTQCSAL